MKKDAAETEKAWKGAGQAVGIKIWRIVKFKVGGSDGCLLHDHRLWCIFYLVLCGSMQVKDWPREEYGKFYNGDSYIILNTYKEADSEVR